LGHRVHFDAAAATLLVICKYKHARAFIGDGRDHELNWDNLVNPNSGGTE